MSKNKCDWSYDGLHGPSTWKDTYPACGGAKQSPINIDYTRVVKAERPCPVWANYRLPPTKVVLINNSHTVEVRGIWEGPDDGKTPTLEIDEKTFELDHIHFHWGMNNNEGSEHAINGKKFPLELQGVHYRVVGGLRFTPPEAIVIGLLYEISEIENSGLESILKYMSDVMLVDTEKEIPTFPMNMLIPEFTGHFFHYEGSLTTPPCSEVATYLIRDRRYTVTEKQMDQFRILLNENGKCLSGNFRPLQPLHGRLVYYVFPKTGQRSSIVIKD